MGKEGKVGKEDGERVNGERGLDERHDGDETPVKTLDPSEPE